MIIQITSLKLKIMVSKIFVNSLLQWSLTIPLALSAAWVASSASAQPIINSEGYSAIGFPSHPNDEDEVYRDDYDEEDRWNAIAQVDEPRRRHLARRSPIPPVDPVSIKKLVTKQLGTLGKLVLISGGVATAIGTPPTLIGIQKLLKYQMKLLKYKKGLKGLLGVALAIPGPQPV